jgi:hypothetical protein
LHIPKFHGLISVQYGDRTEMSSNFELSILFLIQHILFVNEELTA